VGRCNGLAPQCLALLVFAEIDAPRIATRRERVVMTRAPMNELATAQIFVLGSALIVAAFLTLEWVETRRTRVDATHRRDRDRPRQS
jgi:hypothetical protein